MRISDWSSDVCSSDLLVVSVDRQWQGGQRAVEQAAVDAVGRTTGGVEDDVVHAVAVELGHVGEALLGDVDHPAVELAAAHAVPDPVVVGAGAVPEDVVDAVAIEVADGRAEHAGDRELRANDAGCGAAPEQVDGDAGAVAPDVPQAVAVALDVARLLVLTGPVGGAAGRRPVSDPAAGGEQGRA